MHPSKLLPLATFAMLAFAPCASAAGNGALDRAFNKADINENGFLDSVEFMALQSRRTKWTDATYRFQFADADDDGLLSPVEFRASNGGKDGGKPSITETFALADLDDNSSLDPAEYSLTQAQTLPSRKLLRNFDRKDRNDDALLGPAEFGPAIGVPF